MYHNTDIKTRNTLVLESMDSSVFSTESIRAYRQRMKRSRPNHVLEKLDNDVF